MSLLDTSLDRFYRSVYEHNERIPERFVGFISGQAFTPANINSNSFLLRL